MNSEHILLICESPNKVKTLSQFLPKNYTVLASVGHVTKIADGGLYNMGIDIDNDFTPKIVIDPKKRDVVKLLKENAKLADKVILATDADREGEAISNNLLQALKIPESKYERITFHEITKKAVEEALAHPRKIDKNMVISAQTRSVLDKIVGYRISPIVMTKVSAKSAGRVQSAALKVLAMREEEINNFVPKTFYEIWLSFSKNKKEYKCQYKGTTKKSSVSIASKNAAEKIIEECNKTNEYIVKEIKDSERSLKSKPPFTTSTFQQAASSLLGYAPKKAMECAQHLFEGIDLNGSHVALITYIRTDSTTMNADFVKELEKFVKTKYGPEYYSPVKQAKKKEHDQDGHEAIRCVDLNMTPEKLSQYITDQQLIKVYKIIYERTVASSMSDCIITDREFNIFNGEHRFAFVKHKIKFDGFKKVYLYKEESEEDESYPDLKKDEKLKSTKLELKEKQTQPPSRYSEAGLVKKLEELGIGRPSTFASICNVLTDPDRGFTEKDGKTLKVTDKGMRLSKFLDENFGDIINLNYTAEMEDDLDKISSGKLNNIDFLKEFYKKLTEDANNAKVAQSNKPAPEKLDRVCPNCGHNLVVRVGKYGKFIACSNYPKCKYTEKILENGESSKNENKNNSVGIKCPDCGSDIVIRTNKQGQKFYACSGFPKHKRIFTDLEIKKLAEEQNTLLISKDSD